MILIATILTFVSII